MNNHIKQSPMLTLPSLGGGSHSPLVRKPPAGGGGSGPGSPGVQYTPDGTAMYVLSSDNIVRRYNIGTAFDISTTSYSAASSSIGSSTRGLGFKGDGTKFYYITYSSGWFIRTYNLSTPWDITNITAASEEYELTNDLTSGNEAHSFQFKHTGEKLYVVDGGSGGDNYILEYNLGTAWDVSTASYSQKTAQGTFNGFSTGYLRGLCFSDDGMYCITCNGGNTYAFKWSLSTAWDVSTFQSGQPSTKTYYQATNNFSYSGANLQFRHNGQDYYMVGASDEQMTQFKCNGNYQIGGAQQDNPGNDSQYSDYIAPYKFYSGFGSSTYAMAWGDGGNYIYFSNGYGIKKVPMTTPYDIRTINWSHNPGNGSGQSVSYSPNIGYGPRDISFNTAGTKYLIGPEQQNSWVKEFTMSTAWDLSTNQDTGNSLDLTAGGSNFPGGPGGGEITPDGLHIYATKYNTNSIWHWTMTTPWDITTASFSEVGTNFQNANSSCRISPNGTQMITRWAQSDTERFYSYDLSTAWDVSTATFTGSFNVQDDLQGVPVPIFATGWLTTDNSFVLFPYYGYCAYIIKFGSNWPFTMSNAVFNGKSPHYNFHTVTTSQTRGYFLK